MKPNTSLTTATSRNGMSVVILARRRHHMFMLVKPTMRQAQQHRANNNCGDIANSPAPSRKEVTRRVGGFTLTELLVVIALIALLMGLLIPGLQWGTKKAHDLRCECHLQALAKAFRMYADHHGGRFPAVTDIDQVPQQIRHKLLPYVSNEKVFYCPVSGEPYDYCVTPDPKTTLANVRLDLISQPNRIVIGGESSVGTHKDDMLYVINGAFEVEHITVQEWFNRITTPHS